MSSSPSSPPTGASAGRCLKALLCWRRITLSIAATGLAACGGGGGETPAGPAPAATAASSPAVQGVDGNAGADGVNVTGPVPSTDAARFLIQATYGPNADEINALAASGYAGWLNQQFKTAPMDSHWTYVMERKGPPGCNPCDAEYINAVMESFWMQAVRGPDQLRQRTVFALSQIFVVSTVNSAVEIQPDAHSSYLDMLSRNAFGNFRTLLEQVSTHPTMAHYLSHMRNDKEDPVSGRIPDENYARELMQLFSIGLWQLNPDGSRKKDAQGQDIPTYNQNDVMGMARVFTGWSWGGPDKSEERWNGWVGTDWKNQLQNYPQHHSTSAKTFLGTSIPANTSGTASLKIALDTLFKHPNTGPFIGEQLIKRFVTSNPSRPYVGRVAAKFADNGKGVRGDMKAVLRAVLTDPEARNASAATGPNWGKLREPMVRYGNFMRAFNVRASSGYYRIWNLEDPVSSLGQNPLRAPSVFNWYRPSYAPPGAIMAAGLVAPEFQITHETTVTGYANFIVDKAERETRWWRDNNAAPYGPVQDYLAADYSAELALAGNPAALVDRLKLLLTAGRMTAATRTLIIDAVTAVPANAQAGNARVATAVALTMVSPEFIVQK
jgi:uncharacterized protein (DUF1800 family)